jgi:hypothetical protein
VMFGIVRAVPPTLPLMRCSVYHAWRDQTALTSDAGARCTSPSSRDPRPRIFDRRDRLTGCHLEDLEKTAERVGGTDAPLIVPLRRDRARDRMGNPARNGYPKRAGEENPTGPRLPPKRRLSTLTPDD